MGSTTDKVSGVANQAAGKIKEAAGKATGSEKLQAEGLAQRAKGKGEKLAGDAKQAVKDANQQGCRCREQKTLNYPRTILNCFMPLGTILLIWAIIPPVA